MHSEEGSPRFLNVAKYIMFSLVYKYFLKSSYTTVHLSYLTPETTTCSFDLLLSPGEITVSPNHDPKGLVAHTQIGTETN